MTKCNTITNYGTPVSLQIQQSKFAHAQTTTRVHKQLFGGREDHRDLVWFVVWNLTLLTQVVCHRAQRF